MSASVCPTCNRRMPVAKVTMDKRIVADVERAEKAISSLVNCQTRSDLAAPSMQKAIALELTRMRRAVTDYRLLWSIYRRTDKRGPYYDVAAA